MSENPKYDSVNSKWPAIVPEITGAEALAAAKRLYRFAMKRAWAGQWNLTSGRRFTWPRRGTFYVNPNRDGFGVVNGWHDLVHMMSHYCHRQLHPKRRPHDTRHQYLERDMVAYVVAQGWLDGKLKREPAPASDPKVVKLDRIAAGIKRWEAKQRRAENALKKLRRQQRRTAA